MNFIPHSDSQERALFSEEKILAYLTGVQVGKTTVGAVRMKMRMHQYVDQADAFIIGAPTYKILQQSTLPAFLNLMAGMGEYSKADAVFHMYGGGRCYMRTATEPDSIVGITNVRHIWIDEAGKVTLYFFENVMARSAFRDCQIDLTSSPYTLNWLFKNIVRPKQKDPNALPNINLIQAASWDNPYMPKATIEHARQTMDARRFNALFGGKWERMAGLVYDCFDEVENQCEPFTLPAGTRMVGGIDWGFTDPFVFQIRGITPAGQHYGVSEFYKTGLTLNEQAHVIARGCQVHDVDTVYADPSQPGAIEEVNRVLSKGGCRGRVQPANNDIRVGIDRHYELLKTRRLKYFRGTHKYTLDEYDTYHYPEPQDLKPDQDAKAEKPVGQWDHAMDCARYITAMTYLGAKRHIPVVVSDTPKEENQHERIERLKRPKRASGSSESW